MVLLLQQRTEAEVEELDLPAMGQQEVRRLDVAVQDAPRVGVGQPVGGLGSKVDHVGGREGAPCLQQGLEGQPLRILHGDEVAVADAIGIEGPDHVRVIQSAHQLHLALETGERPGASDVSRLENLQGDDPAHHSVRGLVDLAHRTLAEELEDDIAAEAQALRLPLEDLARLVFGQNPILDQAGGQLVRQGGVLPLGHDCFKFFELPFGQDA